MLFYDIFRFSYLIIFTGLHAVLMLGIFLEWLREKKALKNTGGETASVSVIIPVHNESRRIEGLLKSLEKQDYPHAEFIFIDDRSQDETAEMINRFIEKAETKKARLLYLKKNPGPNNKQYALARGIEISSGELLLFTDADCEMPPHWIRGMVKRMSDTQAGAIIAPVLKRMGGKSFFHLYQCFEHGIRYIYLTGSTGLGAAGGGFGNNLIFRRVCLDVIGGYEKIPPSPTEDAALVSVIRSCSGYKIRAALGSDVHIITQGENNWKTFFNQTIRWNNGGLFSPDIATRLNFSFLMITIGMGTLAMPLLPFIPSIWPLPAGIIISMTFNSIACLGLLRASLPGRTLALGLNLFFTPMYFTFLTIMGFLGIKPKWKGEVFKS